jgi:hypothetical protein
LEQKTLEQKKLISKLIEASNKISESKNGQGCYIQIMPSQITKMAEENGVSFDEMCQLLVNLEYKKNK